MLGRWFKRSSRLEHPDREIRLQAVQALDSEQAADAQAMLENIVKNDADADVRRAAMPHVVNPDVLAVLLDDPVFAPAAAQHIAARIGTGHAAACHDHDLVLQARITASDGSDLDTLWPLLKTAEQCAEVALRTRTEQRERVLTHPLLQTEAGLTALQKLARGKDKSCHRHARERLDAIKQARTHFATCESRLAELDVSIDKALKSQPTDAVGLIAHRQKLAKLHDMRTAAAASTEAALQSLTAAGAAVDDISLPADPLAGVDLSPPDPADDPFAPLLEELTQLGRDMCAGLPLADVSARRDELTQNWLGHADRLPPTQAQHDQFEAIAQQYQRYRTAWERLQALAPAASQAPAPLPQPLEMSAALQQLLNERRGWRKRWQKPVDNLAWPADHECPAEAAAAAACLARVNSELEQITGFLSNAEQELADAVKGATEAIDGGHIEEAKRHLRAARELQKAGIKQFERELGALSARVAEFRDWQRFATDPKRQELLEELQALAENPLEPESQAAKLRALRDQWRQLGRPASAQEAEQQKRFDELADIAFAPCRDYYAERGAVREANLAKRAALCDQLSSYLAGTDWSTADMDAAETIMRSARDEWHKYHPCERRALKPVEQRFEQLQDELHGRVKAWWDGNVATKRGIVERAQALLNEDVASQVEGAKNLQQAWREVGSTPRGLDQRLWREFRQVCDQIFTQRDAHKAAEVAERNEQYAALERAVAALESAAAKVQKMQADAPASRKELDALSNEINTAAADVKMSGALRKRFEQAQSGYRAALAQEGRKQAEADLAQWQAWDAEVSQAEQQGTAVEQPHAIFAARAAGTATPLDWLKLTLEAEIAADLPSPAEDQSARMALQVELMNAGRRNLAAEDHRELRKRWCEAGPKDAVADELRARFFVALKARL